jgi:hypothetical protein
MYVATIIYYLVVVQSYVESIWHGGGFRALRGAGPGGAGVSNWGSEQRGSDE